MSDMLEKMHVISISEYLQKLQVLIKDMTEQREDNLNDAKKVELFDYIIKELQSLYDICVEANRLYMLKLEQQKE